MRVAVVTDSTSNLPAELAARERITVVPMQVRIGDHLDDEARVSQSDLLDAMRGGTPVSTEPPDPAAFFWAYQAAAANGADAVVSVHVSSRQSQTYEHATQAAGQAGLPVHVVDSRTCGMSVGYATAAAARGALAGADPRRVMDILAHRLGGSSALIYVDTLEYLRRGGRIGAAAKFVGSALSLKPLLTLVDGQIAPLERVLGATRALRRLVETAVRRAADREVDIAVEHVGVPDQARALLHELGQRLPRTRATVVTEVSSVLAVHLGPGALGITISPI
ncbi:DegV family protein [Actinokineospora sp.]|uniref:DegV family protein n=1 Tax=Actinokineospora sp. TaxID=1872133 RepID=UPI004037BA94